MKTTIIIEADKLTLWRVLTQLKNAQVEVVSVQHGEDSEPEVLTKDTKIAHLCERFQDVSDQQEEAKAMLDAK